MTPNISNASRLRKNAPSNPDPFLWLYEILIPALVDTDPAEPLRLTSFDRRIEFGYDDAGEPLVWYPAPIENSGFSLTSEGDLPVAKLSVGFHGYGLLADIDERGGLVNAPVTMRLLNVEDLSDPSAGAIFVGEVMSCSATTSGVQLEVSAPSMLRRQFPRWLYRRRRCRHVFGDGKCGFDKTAPGAGFLTCPGTITACEERGDDEVSRGYPRLHPARFGAFPGIPRSS